MKSSKSTTYQRTIEIYQLMLQGLTYTDLIRYGREKWGVCSRSIEKYIQKANEMVLGNTKETIELMRSKSTSRYMRWMAKFEKEGKLRDAATMQMRIDKINGLEIINIKTPDTTPADKSLIEGLLAQGENDRS